MDPASDALRAQPASPFTAAANAAVADLLPLERTDDIERSLRGRLDDGAPVAIATDADPGRLVWNSDDFEFLHGEPTDTTNPSLWRHQRMTAVSGVFELCDGMYQVRGYDLANITFVRGDTGWLVIDPLTAAETARAALAAVNTVVEERPVTGVIFTHSHIDHFGGVLGVVSAAQVATGEIPLIAPEGFLEAAVSENVIAGPAMLRRASYMYGGQLPCGPQGTIGAGLGTAAARGSVGLLAPNDLVRTTGETRTIDGIEIEFQMTPDSEAPAEMNFYFPQFRALCMAENCSCVMHNLYTLRGAHTRDALAWSKYIHEALQRFGPLADLCFMSHNWPVWGSDEIAQFLATQRDTYRYLHDQTMRLANQGLVADEIAEQLDLPPSLAETFSNRGYYGTVNHNVKAVFNRYLGWFDGNPAHLHPHPPVERAVRYVDAIGGMDRLLAVAQTAFDDGDYRWVAELVNHAVFAQPDHVPALVLQAAALEQLGYQAESAPWRNFYLTGAAELRTEAKAQLSGAAAEPEPSLVTGQAAQQMLAAMPVSMMFDAFGVRLDGPAADGQELRINWSFADIEQDWVLGLSHGALHCHEGTDPDAACTIRVDHATLALIMSGATNPMDEMVAGRLSLEGDAAAVLTFFGLLDTAVPRFNIVTP